MKRIAILTSGGDSPGMNAAIRSAAMFCIARGAEPLGVRAGYEGLLGRDLVALTASDVAGIVREGGTVLGTARSKAFREREGRDAARRVLSEERIDGLIVVGGNGSLAGAHALATEDPALPTRVVGIPASIDNDVAFTAYSIGVDTAVNTIVEACDRIADTASAHDRAFIVEVMGRDSGYLAMASGIGAGASAVLFKESKKSEVELVDQVFDVILRAQSKGRASRRVLVIKAEGVTLPTHRLKELVDERLLSEPSTAHVETRVTVLGHVVRGGRPSAFDRMLASRLAHVALRVSLDGQTDVMIGWAQGGIPPGVGRVSELDPHTTVLSLGAVIAESEKLVQGESPIVRWRAKIFDEVSDVLAT
ncbi:MAG: 6-phosphofructokinase [Deltaproteobacteria bacterium]|nr:6-phosphofructokinase [Deltaproteobacteria bacterium]